MDQRRPAAEGQRAGQRHRPAATVPAGVQALAGGARCGVGDRRAQARAVVDRAGPARDRRLVPARPVRRRRLRRDQPGRRLATSASARSRPSCCAACSGCCRRWASRRGSTRRTRPASRSSRYERKDGTTVDVRASAPPTTCASPARRSPGSPPRSASACSARRRCCARWSSIAPSRVRDQDGHPFGRKDRGRQLELTYNLSEPRNHSYVANGVVVRNCSEYMHLDNSACNLASINLLHFLDDEGNFDVDAFRHTVEIVFTAQEILVGRADYPTPSIAETSRDFRQLGLGYANLGALLMALGLPYDSADGRAWAGGHHVADDRARLRHERPHGQPDGPVRRVRRQRGAHAAGAADAPRRQLRDRRHRRRAGRAAGRRPGVVGGRRA